MKEAGAYEALNQEEKHFLSDVAEKVALLAAEPQARDCFSRSLKEFAEYWRAYKTAQNARDSGTWQASMGKPDDPLATIWPYADDRPAAKGVCRFPYCGGAIRRVLGAYALLAVIHDNVQPQCPPIAVEFLPQEVAEDIWRDLVTGANQEDHLGPKWVIPTDLIEAFLREVKTDIEGAESPQGEKPRLRQSPGEVGDGSNMANSSTKHDPDFADPYIQGDPSCTAILDFLRKLTLHFTSMPRELTAAEWTAFLALTKKGAIEGILRMVFTPAHATEPVIEYHHVQGDYINNMVPGLIRRDRPTDLRLFQARLTGTGERWASILQGGKAEDTVKIRAFVLEMVYQAPVYPGSDTLICPPEEDAGLADVQPTAGTPPPNGRPGKTPNTYASTVRNFLLVVAGICILLAAMTVVWCVTGSATTTLGIAGMAVVFAIIAVVFALAVAGILKPKQVSEILIKCVESVRPSIAPLGGKAAGHETKQDDE